MLQTEESENVTLNVGTQSDSMLLMQNGDPSLNEGTVNLVNLGMSLEQAHHIRTAICNIL